MKEKLLVKQDPCDTIIKMALIKEETEDVKIEETFRVKEEDTEEQTDLLPLKQESQELNVMEEEDHDFITGEKSFNFPQTEKTDRHVIIHSEEKPFKCRPEVQWSPEDSSQNSASSITSALSEKPLVSE
ncbi:gastrula zinc finger protein XlCGF8.2DB-like [Pimephales promelas]|nr:gastrula zinc finger protein XlCGF8.2DB-like [Pimephales promelas]